MSSSSESSPLSPSFRDIPRPPSRRRLPSLPRARPVSATRPLPPIPRPLWCKECRTCITSINHLLPLSAIPPESRAFRGFSGKASLFTEVQHVTLSRPSVQLMATGAHTMAQITCAKCSAYLGWQIVRAHETSEKWKEGNFLLELENLYAITDMQSTRDDQRISPLSDSDDSS